jgi:hypothetical protein
MVPTLVARLGQVLFPRAYFCTLYALLCTSFVLTGAENGVAWLPRISDPSAARLLCGQHKLRSVPGRARAREPAKQVIPLSRSDACSAQCAALTKLLDTRSTDRTGTRSTRVTSTKKTSRCSPGGKGFEVFLPLYTAPGIKHLGFPQMLGVGALVDSVLRLLSAPKPDGAQFTRWNRVSD